MERRVLHQWSDRRSSWKRKTNCRIFQCKTLSQLKINKTARNSWSSLKSFPSAPSWKGGRAVEEIGPIRLLRPSAAAITKICNGPSTALRPTKAIVCISDAGPSSTTTMIIAIKSGELKISYPCISWLAIARFAKVQVYCSLFLPFLPIYFLLLFFSAYRGDSWRAELDRFEKRRAPVHRLYYFVAVPVAFPV